MAVGAPVALAAVEVFHPLDSTDALEQLLPVADRWLLVHLLQAPLLGLLALAVYLIVEGLDDGSTTATSGRSLDVI